MSLHKLKNVLFLDNIACGYLYFYIHFITEIVCFYFLSTITNGSHITWLLPFIYDGLAFVPQSIIGYMSDKYPKLNIGLIGSSLLFLGITIYAICHIMILSLTLVCLGNCFIHISGAENTLKNSKGKLSHSAIFVAGGSFGVITGKLLSKSISIYWLFPLILTMIPFLALANTYKENNTKSFNYNNRKISSGLIIILMVLVVAVRGYMGYGIPTSWNKTIPQTIILYCTMGIGKALGGILSDAFGIRKIAALSTIAAIPFLCFGDNHMMISLIGVMMFSMTMPITLAVLVSILKNTSGLAFGLTTIGLFLGTIPVFFIRITNQLFNNISLIILSLICIFTLLKVIRKEDFHDKVDI